MNEIRSQVLKEDASTSKDINDLDPDILCDEKKNDQEELPVCEGGIVGQSVVTLKEEPLPNQLFIDQPSIHLHISSKEDVVFSLESTLLSFLHSSHFPNGKFKLTKLYPIAAGLLVVLFLSLHYLIQRRSLEKWFKATISQLDCQLYENQSEHETQTADLQRRFEIEKFTLSGRIADLKNERSRFEKELEMANETASEANRKFERLLAPQVERDKLQQSMKVLQQKMIASLITENKRLRSYWAELKKSNRNYQEKACENRNKLLKIQQEQKSWTRERQQLTEQLNLSLKEATEWRQNAKKAEDNFYKVPADSVIR